VDELLTAIGSAPNRRPSTLWLRVIHGVRRKIELSYVCQPVMLVERGVVGLGKSPEE